MIQPSGPQGWSSSAGAAGLRTQHMLAALVCWEGHSALDGYGVPHRQIMSAVNGLHVEGRPIVLIGRGEEVNVGDEEPDGQEARHFAPSQSRFSFICSASSRTPRLSGPPVTVCLPGTPSHPDCQRGGCVRHVHFGTGRTEQTDAGVGDFLVILNATTAPP